MFPGALAVPTPPLHILLCAQEYGPKGSGIANVAQALTEELRALGHRVTICSPEGPDVRIGSQTLIERTGGFGILAYWRQLARFVNKNHSSYDVIWVHNPLFLTKITAPNVVSTVHSTYEAFYRERAVMGASTVHGQYFRFMRWCERRCYAKNTFRTTALGTQLKRELITVGLPRKLIHIIPNGVDTKRFKPRARARRRSIPRDALLGVYVGRFDYPKRPQQLVRTFAHLQATNHWLLLVGGGPSYEETAALVKTLGATNIVLAGKVPHKKVAALYQEADFFVMDSALEGQPLTTLEALSTGLPLLLNNIPSFADLVATTKCGALVSFENPKQAAKQIAAYITPQTITRKKKAARACAERTFAWPIVAKQYEEVFRASAH